MKKIIFNLSILLITLLNPAIAISENEAAENIYPLRQK